MRERKMSAECRELSAIKPIFNMQFGDFLKVAQVCREQQGIVDGEVVGIEEDHRFLPRLAVFFELDFFRSASRSRMASCKIAFSPSSSVKAPIVRRQSLDFCRCTDCSLL
jgi:hypothetical protein